MITTRDSVRFSLLFLPILYILIISAVLRLLEPSEQRLHFNHLKFALNIKVHLGDTVEKFKIKLLM